MQVARTTMLVGAALATVLAAAAEQVLWRRFEKWHAAWRNRVGELTVVDSGSQTDPQVLFERSLVGALAYAENWITAPSKLERLRTLCLTKPNRERVDRLLDRWCEPTFVEIVPAPR